MGVSATSSNSASVRGGIAKAGRRGGRDGRPRTPRARPPAPAPMPPRRRAARCGRPDRCPARGAGRRPTARRSSGPAGTPSRARPAPGPAAAAGAGVIGTTAVVAGVDRYVSIAGMAGAGPTGRAPAAAPCAGPGPPAAGAGAGAAGFEGAAARPDTSSAGSAMTPISSPTGTWPPGPTRILRRTPEPKASTSTLALSVSISAMTSPPLTASPSFFSHWMTLPVSIASDSFGISTLVIMRRTPCGWPRRSWPWTASSAARGCARTAWAHSRR